MEPCVLRQGQCLLYLPAESREEQGQLHPHPTPHPALRVLGRQEAGFHPAVLGIRRGSVSLEFLLVNPGVLQNLNQFGLSSMKGEKKVRH